MTKTIHQLTYSRWIYISGAAFLVPFFCSQQQLPLGIFINAMLVISTVRLGKYEQASMIIIPNLAVLLRGVLFGSSTMYMLFFTPGIWIANWCLVRSIALFQKQYGLFLSGIIGGIIKSMILFGMTFIFISGHIVPSHFLINMGYMQLATSLLGVCAAYIFLRIYDSANRRI